ncbi:AIPR family protein [Halobacillus sp. Cin3]|uniref:AIPR family protein n=1 Tax=Halobacillus sp. Cin3 TaxID=2928441 RepID=UPI00248EAD09|nr:AIPR family protein [Halobacillus sp. Cin3]
MIKSKLQNSFIQELLENVESNAEKSGSYQSSFLEMMLEYIDPEDEPEVLIPPYTNSNKNILLNAYSYDEEQQNLTLYVVDYDFDQGEQSNWQQSASMTYFKEVANKAKRFVTNSKNLLDIIDKSLEAYDLAKLIVNEHIEEVNIIVVTNLIYESNKLIDLSTPYIDTTNVNVWDVERVQQIVDAEQGGQSFYIDFAKDFGMSIEMMYVPQSSKENFKGEFSCYIGFMSAEMLAKAYEVWGPKLVERNVRSFLQARGGTNKGIRDTLKDPEQKQIFVAYNNGISCIAHSGDIQHVGDGINLYYINGLEGWQIVNGGQTTASIYQAYKSGVDLSDVYIQTKLTVIHVESTEEKDQHLLADQMISNISQYSNTQNKINKSDLMANTRFLSDIEKYSRDVWIPTRDLRKSENKWYFERARGQYMVDVNRRNKGKEQKDFKKTYPKEKVLTKVELAKYYISWEGYPHISSKGGEMAFKKFMDENKMYWKHQKDEKNQIIPLQELDLIVYKKLISRSIINIYVKEKVNEMKLKGYKANVIYYTVALLKYLYSHKIDLLKVWEEQGISEAWDELIYTIANKVLNFLKESAGEQNITQWAKKEECWEQLKRSNLNDIKNLV